MSTIRITVAYKQVADSLRRQILGNQFKPGQRLPPEREMCRQYGASRITVRRALQVLADEMLVLRRQGSGTFVSPTPTRKIPLLNTDFSGSVADHAPDLTRRLESRKWMTPNEEVCARLQLSRDAKILYARRTDLLDGSPVAYDDVYLPESDADRLDKNDLAELRFLERWQSVQQIQIDYVTQEIEAMAAHEEQASLLGIVVDSPLLMETNVFFLDTATACGLFQSYYRSEMFRVVSTVQLRAVGQPELDPQR